jgi:hypothetical protein
LQVWAFLCLLHLSSEMDFCTAESLCYKFFSSSIRENTYQATSPFTNQHTKLLLINAILKFLQRQSGTIWLGAHAITCGRLCDGRAASRLSYDL